jgi:addiction module RelE/StbE family toxin
MRQILFTKQAGKKLKQINKSTPQVAKAIKNLLLSLAEDVKQVRGETLQGYSDFKKFRVGKYRVIYTYNETTVTVAILDKREIVYQSFEKLMKNSDFKI